MGYHKREIPEGVYGESSKIAEEYHEFCDAIDQRSKVMQAIELCDLIGAIEGYAIKYLGLSLDDLVKFSKITSRVFEEGHRKPKGDKPTVILEFPTKGPTNSESLVGEPLVFKTTSPIEDFQVESIFPLRIKRTSSKLENTGEWEDDII